MVLFLVYIGLVTLFFVSIGIFALISGNFERFWAMLMSV